MTSRLLKLTFRGLPIILGSYLITLYGVPFFFQVPHKLSSQPQPGLEFTDRHGTPLRRLLVNELKVAEPATLDEVPSHLIQATLDAEDFRFYQHNGIDFLGVARAARDAILERRVVSGASTVTQQLVKITSPPRPRSLPTKVIEALTARHVEMTWEKDDILTAYLNRLPYGNLYTGCRQAAQGYFGKPLGDLSLAECALLAGLPNKPTRLNPYRNLLGAQKRQRWILGRMKINGSITEGEYQTALAEKLVFTPREMSAQFQAPHLIDLMLGNGIISSEDFGDRSVVKSTIDLDLQTEIETIATHHLEALDKDASDRKGAVQSAVVVIENATGDVLALTGSRSWNHPDGGKINGAWTPRSPGSTLKPFTYLLALERGYSASTILPDIPTEFTSAAGTWRPVNFSNRYHGPVTLRHSLANSLNVPAVRVLNDIGGHPILHQTLFDKLGIDSLGPDSSIAGLGLTLGGKEVRLLEITNAYAALARLGSYLPYRLQLGPELMTSKSTRVFDPAASFIIADILSDNHARAATFGLHSPLRLPFRVAAKTGTSSDYRDNWTIGFTPEFTVGVWVGRFDNAPLPGITGAAGAGPIFHDVMSRLHRDTEPTWYATPQNIVTTEIDPMTGKRREASGRFDIFRTENLPPKSSPTDYADGKVILPAIYAQWAHSTANHIAHQVTVQSIPSEIRILSPLPGTTAYLDPDLPNSGSRFPLKSSYSEEITWASETLQIEQDESGKAIAILQPGTHYISAQAANGQQIETWLIVEAL